MNVILDAATLVSSAKNAVAQTLSVENDIHKITLGWGQHRMNHDVGNELEPKVKQLTATLLIINKHLHHLLNRPITQNMSACTAGFSSRATFQELNRR